MTRGFWIAGAIVVAANAFAFAGAAYNRSAVVSRVELTDTDLFRWTTSAEDSGLTLRFNWLEFYFSRERRITEARLREIGFDLPGTNADPEVDRRILPRKAFIVLAVGDPERKEWLDDFYAHQSPNTSPSDPPPSRLIVIDAGLDDQALRAKYSDPSHFLILHGVVSATRYTRASGERWEGQVVSLLPPSVHVPTEMRAAASQTHPREYEPRFSLVLCVGRRGEPWVESVTPR